jgi:hypothetical protein
MSDTDITYTLILENVGAKTFVMPEGFWPDVKINCWGAGGGNESSLYRGGGGGYAYANVNISSGDTVTLQLGQPGSPDGTGGIDSSYKLFRGGNGTTAGGGGASWVAVNNTIVCCGAGGGGGGSSGSGVPGGNITKGLAIDTRGGNGPGGGGGAGYLKGGVASGGGGGGGQNYGNLTIAGSGSLGAGKNVDVYPGNKIGDAGYPGYIAIVFRKKLNAFIKNPDSSGDWVNISAAFTKVPAGTVTVGGTTYTITSAGWKQIQQGFVKINGDWKPLLTDEPIELYRWIPPRVYANIIISSDTNDYNLYNNLPINYFEGLMDIDVWVLPNVVITGNTSSTAFTISNFDTNDRISLRNYGSLQGQGGSGGGGSYTYSINVNPPKTQSGIGSGKGGTTTTATAAATAGSAGGTGLLLQSPIILQNNGTIAGGGGGGGGGGLGAGGRGGGGAGFGVGFNNGTLTSGGAGQDTTYDGGNGGGRGQPGSPGEFGAAGGTAGYAIQGIINVVLGSNIGSYFGPLV